MDEINPDKVYFTISEVASLFGVNASLIRFWEKEFDILKPHKNKKGNRLFTRPDIENIRIIYHLVKEKGYTLQGAKEKLKAGQPVSVATAETVNALNRLKTFLLALKAELDEKDEAENTRGVSDL